MKRPVTIRRDGGLVVSIENGWNPDKLHFTADPHFFHHNITIYSGRPWLRPDGKPDVQAMNEGLIANWNEAVGPEDDVIVLGDMAMGGKSKAGELSGILSRLNGYIYNVPGNHDGYALDPPCSDHFTILPDFCQIKVQGQRIVLCHYSMRVWPKSHRGSWMLYGHSHGTLETDYSVKSFDVGMDCHNWYPISFRQVQNILRDHGEESPFIKRPGRK